MINEDPPPGEPLALMIDLECLSLRPDAFVVQVGVCMANPITRRYWLEPRNFWVSEDQPGRIDLDTVTWWMQQEKEVSKTVFDSTVRRHSAREIFRIFEEIVRWNDCDVWASPAMYDLPILTNMFDGRKPWKYNRERDLMTFYKLIDPLHMLEPPPIENAHNAAADAKWQMEYLFNLMAHFLKPA